MADRKTGTEKLQDIEKRIEQLKVQRQAIVNREKEKERKGRTRRLIQNGALAEKYLACEGISPEEFENVLQRIVSIPGVNQIKEVSNSAIEKPEL